MTRFTTTWCSLLAACLLLPASCKSRSGDETLSSETFPDSPLTTPTLEELADVMTRTAQNAAVLETLKARFESLKANLLTPKAKDERNQAGASATGMGLAGDVGNSDLQTKIDSSLSSLNSALGADWSAVKKYDPKALAASDAALKKAIGDIGALEASMEKVQGQFKTLADSAAQLAGRFDQNRANQIVQEAQRTLDDLTEKQTRCEKLLGEASTLVDQRTSLWKDVQDARARDANRVRERFDAAAQQRELQVYKMSPPACPENYSLYPDEKNPRLYPESFYVDLGSIKPAKAIRGGYYLDRNNITNVDNVSPRDDQHYLFPVDLIAVYDVPHIGKVSRKVTLMNGFIAGIFTQNTSRVYIMKGSESVDDVNTYGELSFPAGSLKFDYSYGEPDFLRSSDANLGLYYYYPHFYSYSYKYCIGS